MRLTAVLSAALVLVTPWLDATPSRRACSSASGCSRWRRCSSSLLEALGRGRWALLAVRRGLAAEALLALEGTAPFPGAGLVGGSGLVAVAAAACGVALLARPARTLATALWIT